MLINTLYPAALHLILLLLCIFLLIHIRDIRAKLSSISKNTWLAIIGILLFGFCIRILLPHVYLVYFDEFEHINTAQNILYNGQYCTCVNGTVYSCNQCMLRPYPGSRHIVLSWMFVFFGENEYTGFLTSAFLGVMTAFLCFLFLFLLLKKEKPALFGAFVFCFLPLHLLYSRTTVMEIAALFFVMLSLFTSQLYMQSKKKSLFILWILSFALAVHSRPENILLVLVFLPYAKMFATKQSRNILLLSALLMLLIIGTSAYVLYQYSIANKLEYPDGPISSGAANLMRFAVPNLLFFLNPDVNIILLVPLFLIGLIILYNEKRESAWMLIIFFFSYFIIISSDNWGKLISEDRFGLMLSVPLIIGASAAMGILFTNRSAWAKYTALLLSILIVANIAYAIPHILENSQMQDEYFLMQKMKNNLEKNSTVLAYNPAIVIVLLRTNSAMLSINAVANPADNESLIILKDFWWIQNKENSNEIEQYINTHYYAKTLAEQGQYSAVILTKKESFQDNNKN